MCGGEKPNSKVTLLTDTCTLLQLQPSLKILSCNLIMNKGISTNVDDSSYARCGDGTNTNCVNGGEKDNIKDSFVPTVNNDNDSDNKNDNCKKFSQGMLGANEKNLSGRRRRKLRALVIGGNGSNQEKDGNIKNGRCEKIERMFQSEGMSYDFDPPVFSPCVPARSLRNKNGFLLHAGRAGLIPDEEWNVMRPYLERREKEREKKEKEEKEKKGDDYNGVPNQKTHTTEEEGDVDDVLDLLTKENVPIIPGRRGASWDVSVHYSVELWRKGRRLGKDHNRTALFKIDGFDTF